MPKKEKIIQRLFGKKYFEVCLFVRFTIRSEGICRKKYESVFLNSHFLPGR